jgi:hypothetical protein
MKIEDKHIRVYSVLVLFLAAGRFLFIDQYQGLSLFFKWVFISAKLTLAYTVCFLYRVLKLRSKIAVEDRPIVSLIFCLNTLMIVLTIFQHIKNIWVSVSLGVVGGGALYSWFFDQRKDLSPGRVYNFCDYFGAYSFCRYSRAGGCV